MSVEAVTATLLVAVSPLAPSAVGDRALNSEGGGSARRRAAARGAGAEIGADSDPAGLAAVAAEALVDESTEAVVDVLKGIAAVELDRKSVV